MRSTSVPARTTAVASVLCGVSFFLTVASVNVPHDAGDAELVAWWRDGGLTDGMVSMGFAVLTAVLFAVVANHLLALTGDRAPRLTAFARSMATAFTCSLLVSAALRGVVGHLVRVEDGPLPDVGVLRYSTALNYTVLGVVVMACFGLAVAALGALAIREELLPVWAGRTGIGCGMVVLVAVVLMYGAFTVPVAILWCVATAVAVLRTSPGEPAPVSSARTSARAAAEA